MRRTLILNVDDNEISRYLRTQCLSAENFDLVEARTGGEALRSTFELQPDLVLLDIHMPDMDGIEVCRKIKSDPRTQGVMVLHISASAVGIADAVRGLDRADGYLVEPVEPELLLAHVRCLLRLRESEAALRRSNERLRQFANLAGHDLQEPLRSIVSYSSLLEMHAQSMLDAEGKEYLQYVIRGASKLNQLLADILVYSRASTLEDVGSRRVSLDDCLRKAISIHESAIERGDAQIDAGPLPVVMGDETGITQVLQNLLSNSIKYRKPGQCVRIHVAAKRRVRDVLVSVSDDGQGFSQAYAEQVFGVFKRLHTSDVPGSGIGLAVCRAIIEQHGGVMRAEAQEGVGATFHFTLPEPVNP
jgi:signal transduction histidine kinase